MSAVLTPKRLPPPLPSSLPGADSQQRGPSREAPPSLTSQSNEGTSLSRPTSKPLHTMSVRPADLQNRGGEPAPTGSVSARESKRHEPALEQARFKPTDEELAIPEWQMRCRFKPVNVKIFQFFESGLIPPKKRSLLDLVSLAPAGDAAKPEDQLGKALAAADFGSMRKLMRLDRPHGLQ